MKTDADPRGRFEGLRVCSVASSWPATLRLVQTVRAIDANAPLTLLSMAAPPELPPLPNTHVLIPEDLGLGDQELLRLRLVYDRAELEGALIPRLLSWLITQGNQAVLFLDCHTEVHGDLAPVVAALTDHAVVLTPVASVPLPNDDLAPDQRQLLVQGAVSTRLLGVRADAADFLQWWVDRTAWDALNDPSVGLFGAGRWLDLAAASFGAHLLRSAGVDVGTWNLASGALQRRDGRWLLDGTPLVTIDLHGFDPRRPDLLDASLGSRPRVLLSEDRDLAVLLEERSEALAPEPDTASVAEPPPWLDARVRRMALAALRQSHDRDQPPPFVLVPDHSGVLTWLNEVIADPGTPVTRLLHAVWAGRGDLRATFREPLGRDGAALAAWAAEDPEFSSTYGEIHRPVRQVTTERPAPSPGLNIVGFLNAELGLGEAARLLARAAAAGGVPFAPVAFRETDSRQSVEFAGATDAAPFDTTLLCVNADLTPLASARSWGSLNSDRHRIGYWFWEVDRFPAQQLDALHYVDELWAASHFVAECLRSITDKPITVVPHPVAEPTPTHLTRGDLGLDDRFTFAFWFDAFSCTERKNPAALIQAFRQAFRPDEGPLLLVKSINGDRDRAAMEHLWWLARGRSDIVLVDGYRSAVEMRALVQRIDCYASLHRSEGFGQTMADAMMAGKPVIATGHSGNLQYMSDQNSLLVPFELVPVGHGNPPYPPDAQWAHPDIDAAATKMRWVVERPAEAAAMAARGAADVRRTNGLSVMGAHLATAFVRHLDPSITA